MGRQADLSTVTGLQVASDGELDAVVVEAVDQTGFIEGSSWRVHPPSESDITDTREREKVEERFNTKGNESWNEQLGV